MEMIQLENGLSFQLDKNNFTAKAISSPRAKGDIFYPKSISYQSQEYIITTIGKSVFKDNYGIFSINFSEDSEVRTISSKAFSNSSVESITIPSKVETLEDGWCKKANYILQIYISPNNKNFKYLDTNEKVIIGKSDSKSEIFDVVYIAFDDVGTVTIPSEIQEIRPYCFSNCNLTKICFEKDSKLKRIGHGAFLQFKLNEIEIPSSVELLEDGWFQKRNQNLKITIHPDNKFYKTLNNSMIVGKSNPNNEEFDVIVMVYNEFNEIIIDSSIKIINSYAFYDCNKLSKIVFKNDSKLTIIGKNAFSFTSLKNITIPSNVKQIGKRAFSQCNFLESIDFDSNSQLRIIPKYFFDFNKIKNFTIPMNVEQFEEGWNDGEISLKNIFISEKNHNFSFLDKDNKILLGKSNVNIKNFDVLVYANPDIQKVIIPSTIKFIEPFAFYQCRRLQTVEFSEDSKIESIGSNAFYFCSSLAKIKIPSSLKHIGSRCFFYCTLLKEVEIPPDSQLESIESFTFYQNPIESLFIPPKLEIFNDFWQLSLSNLVNISISPENKNFKYLDEDHKLIAAKSKLSDDFDTIVYACTDIKQAFIPSSINYIYPNSFDLCKNLEKIEFSQNSKLISIGNNAFNQTRIETILIPSSVKYIGKQCFQSCKQLKKVEFENNSEMIKMESTCFTNANIESLTIPSKLQVLKNDWCDGLNFLKEIIISPGNDNFSFIDDSHKIIACKSNINTNSYDILAFVLPDVRDVKIPESIKFIGPNAFYKGHIEKVFISKNVHTIGYKAFCHCKSLKYIDFDNLSKLDNVSPNSFMFSSIRCIAFPRKLKKIEISTFIGCNNLHCIEFLADEIYFKNDFYIRKKSLLAFPNADKILIEKNSLYSFVGESLFFLPSNAKIEIII